MLLQIKSLYHLYMIVIFSMLLQIRLYHLYMIVIFSMLLQIRLYHLYMIVIFSMLLQIRLYHLYMIVIFRFSPYHVRFVFIKCNASIMIEELVLMGKDYTTYC